MTDTLERPRAVSTAGAIDCDVHPPLPRRHDLMPYLDSYWQDMFESRTIDVLELMSAPERVRSALRPDWAGHGAGDDDPLQRMQRNLLDPLDLSHAILNVVSGAQALFDPYLAAATCRAINDWLADRWLDRDPRLRASMLVPFQNVEAAVEEIERRAADRRFVQVAIPPRTIEPIGRRRYWPVFEAAEHYGLPIGLHTGAFGQRPNTPSGWSSFYLEEHYAASNSLQTVLTSMILEGVFERFPRLKVVLVEGGFAWLPPLMWRMQREWERMRAEVPHLKRTPAEYVRDHVWLTTQPVEEPPQSRQLDDVLRWVGMDRLLFSTDYPHWDFDHPDYAFRVPLAPEHKAMILRDNAVALFRLA